MKLILLPRKNCVGDHRSVRWIKIVDSAKLTPAIFLIFYSLKVYLHLRLCCRYMDIKQKYFVKKTQKPFKKY